MMNSINVNGKLIDLSIPKVMSILNVTPDSFYQGNRSLQADEIVVQVEKMIQEGANIIDVGGFSTRPNFSHVMEDEELRRVDTAVNIIKRMTDIPISIDTFRSVIIDKIYQNYGGFIVNDISGGRFDNQMIETVAKYQLPYILMVNSDNLSTMFQPDGNSITEHIQYLSATVSKLKEYAIYDIIIDPGFGFCKSIEDNFIYLQELSAFSIFSYPILMGISRKSMIWKTLNISPSESLNGSTVIHTLGVLSGGKIIRTHDVRAAKEVISLYGMLNT